MVALIVIVVMAMAPVQSDEQRIKTRNCGSQGSTWLGQDLRSPKEGMLDTLTFCDAVAAYLPLGQNR